jgi:hypothetical protein
MVLLDITGFLGSGVVIILAILLVLYIIIRGGGFILGLIVNSVLGLIAIVVVNAIFGLGIVFNLLTWIIVALFGLPAVLIIILLKLIGIPIP